MSKPQPSKQNAWRYVFVQVVILGILIFQVDSFGPNINKFTDAGNMFAVVGFIGILWSAYMIRFSLTAMPLPKENAVLETNGPYRYVRHPMYSGVLLLSVGIALGSGNIIKYLLVLCLFILFYYKSKYEETFLIQKFPKYKKYRDNTPRFFPFIKFK